MDGPVNGAFAVGFRDMVVKGQWPNEAKGTAEVIRRIPADKTGFKPHEKSMSAIDLAQHIFGAEAMFVDTVVNGKVDYKASVANLGELPKDPKKLADQYAKWQVGAGAKLAKVPEADLVKSLAFMEGMPATPAFQYLGWLTSHTIHHRGQLDVYLRLMGAKVPVLYGPTADENPFK